MKKQREISVPSKRKKGKKRHSSERGETSHIKK